MSTTPEEQPQVPDTEATLDSQKLESMELDPNSIVKVAGFISKVKSTSGMKKMQAWFDNCDEEEQRKLMRADDAGVIMKVLEKIPNVATVAPDIMKNLIIMAARYGVLEVKPEILEESRGISGDAIYLIPAPVVEGLMRVLGVGEFIPLYKLGKKIHSGDKEYAPKVRDEVKKQMAASQKPEQLSN